MGLWSKWESVVNQLESAFSRKKTFYWFMLVLIGFTIKFDAVGVTSLARGVGLLPAYYTSMLHFFTSSAVDLERLQILWTSVVFKCFSGIVRINGRCVIAGDGIKIGKEGKKMPGVKWLHQSSESNSKAEHITGHSIQVVALLVQGLSTYFAVPLAGQIHEGLRLDNQDQRTLLDKLFEMVISLQVPEAFYLVLDKYYCSGKLMKQFVAKNVHIVTMMKRSAVAYQPAVVSETKKRGRPAKYGLKVKLFSLFDQEQLWTTTSIVPRARKQRGDQNLQDFNAALQQRIARKMHAYHVFILCGFIAQGLLQYLSIHYYKSVWLGFGTWLRTIRENTLPSEMVTALAMARTYDDFLEDEQQTSIFKKFLLQKIVNRKQRYQIPGMAEAA